jgi:hypothetical protein
MEIPKNPQLLNTSPISVYMAIKVTYTNSAGIANKTNFNAVADPIVIDTNWRKVTSDGLDYDIYIYGTASAFTAVPGTIDQLSQDGRQTSALFDEVKIKSGVDHATLGANPFKIIITGAAVQATDNITADEVQTVLVNKLTPPPTPPTSPVA